jgi:hypothetical protein
MSKHTPGPWHISWNGGDPSIDVPRIQAEPGNNIAFIPDYEQKRHEFMANAKLIAAAPKMLKVLKDVEVTFRFFQYCNLIERLPLYYDEVVEVIREAEGE